MQRVKMIQCPYGRLVTRILMLQHVVCIYLHAGEGGDDPVPVRTPGDSNPKPCSGHSPRKPSSQCRTRQHRHIRVHIHINITTGMMIQTQWHSFIYRTYAAGKGEDDPVPVRMPGDSKPKPCSGHSPRKPNSQCCDHVTLNRHVKRRTKNTGVTRAQRWRLHLSPSLSVQDSVRLLLAAAGDNGVECT